MSPSFKLMAKAVGVTTEELDKMMKQGKLFAKDVLPEFGKNLREFAAPGLEGALKSNRVAMNKFLNEVKFAAEEFFKGGFGEGLTDMFNNLSEVIKENKNLWTALGRILGSVLKAFAVALKVVNPLLKIFGGFLDSVTDLLKSFSGLAIPFFTALAYSLLPSVVTQFSLFGMALNAINAKFVTMNALVLKLLRGLKLITGIALIEEIVENVAQTDKESVVDRAVKNLNKFEGYKSFKQSVRDLFPKETYDLADKMGKNSLLGSPEWMPQWQQDLDEKLKSFFFPTSSSSPQAFNQQPITINTQINMDGEVVATNISKTNAFNSAIDRQNNSSYTQGV